VQVQPVGADAFYLDLDGAHVVGAPSAAATPDTGLMVHVKGPLSFVAQAYEASFQPAHDLDLGVLHVAKGVDVGPLMPSPHDADGYARADFSAAGIMLAPIDVPCAALTMADGNDPDLPWDLLGDGHTLIAREPSVLLRPRPGSGVASGMRVSLADPANTDFSRLGVDGNEVEVALSIQPGVTAIGWADGRDFEEPHSGHGYGIDEGYGSDAADIECGALSYPSSVYQGPAKVRVGAPVYASAGRGPWATVATSAPLQVQAETGQGWIQITAVSGIHDDGCGLGIAWVRAADVTLPPGAF
jgi:hypothetical protein